MVSFIIIYLMELNFRDNCNIFCFLSVYKTEDASKEGKEMKITQAKDYRKPLYAIGVAAALAAVAVTGCGPVQYAGDIQPATETTEVELEGEATMATDATEATEVKTQYSKPDGDEELVLAGDVDVCDPEN